MTIPFERHAVVPLAGLYVFRMLGLFMVLPVLSLYGQGYHGATPTLLGLALGAYGFSQALLQIPFGYLSDHFGRKRLIAIGLLLFALGSVVAAMSESVYGLIFGRFLQGCGAIASVVMALVADVTAEENRTKAMALIGASIGVSFSLAMVIGPLITRYFGLAGVFWATAGFAVVGLWLLVRKIPPVVQPLQRGPLQWGRVLRDVALWRLNFGIFVLHFVLMATFVVFPRNLELLGLARDLHWQVYLPVMVLSFLAMVPFMLLGERHNKVRWVFLGSVLLLALAQLGFNWLSASLSVAVGMLFVFFMAFNLLEATLPSWMSKVADPTLKGTATGVYSSCQFGGAFAGGLGGGYALQHGGLSTVYSMCALALLLWLVVAFFQRAPIKPVKLAIKLREEQLQILNLMAAWPGVRHVTWVAQDGVALLQIDDAKFDRSCLDAYEWRTT